MNAAASACGETSGRWARVMRNPRLQRGIHPPEWAQSERDRLDIALGKKGRMHKKGPANGWSPTTHRTVFSPYALGLGWQRDRGMLDWSLAPAARWPKPVLEDYCTHLSETYPTGTQRFRLSGLERVIFVLEPEADRSLFVSAVKRLGKIHPAPDKEQRVQSTIDLEDLGDELMDEGDAGEHRSPRLASALFRTGLQIGLMADMMNRIGEFTMLEYGVGAHVYFEDGRWQMKSSAPDTPTKRRPRKRPIPHRLSHRLERYIDVHRDALCRDLKTSELRYEGPALWVSTRCQPQSENSIRENICRFTKAKFGAPVNPHLIRACGVTTIAIHAPHMMHALQTVIGHGPGSSTTEHNYNMAGSYSASQEWNAMSEAIIECGLQRRRLRRRKR